MQINSRDESNRGEIGRLRANQAALDARLAALEGPPKPVKRDARAEKAAKDMRDKAVADLRHALDARNVYLGRIDSLVTQLCDLVRQERDCRRDLLTAHGPRIEKELRRVVGNDVAVSAIIQRQIGDALRPHSDHRQPELAEAGKLQREAILHSLNASFADDVADLLS
jgi:hypothetical protein